MTVREPSLIRELRIGSSGALIFFYESASVGRSVNQERLSNLLKYSTYPAIVGTMMASVIP